MLSRTQKFLLASAAVCFAFTLYAVLFLDYWVLIISFTLHSLLLLAFCYFCLRVQEDRTPDGILIREELERVKTDRRAKQEEYETKVRELQEAAEEKEKEFAALREKNSSMEKLVEQLKEKTSSLEESAKAADETAALTSILPQLKTSRPASSTVNIIDIANKTAEEFKDAAALAGLIIRVSAKESRLFVKADPEMLRVLFRNIIDNSIKYMKRQGSLIITISSVADELFIVLKDTGEGLPQDEVRHIFELNYQGSNRISGNGLGLAQAKAIVEYYGGTIYAKSTAGEGMGIFVELPAT